MSRSLPPQKMCIRDRLTLDVVAYCDAGEGGEPPLSRLCGRKEGNRLRIGGYKIFLDGSPQARTAWLTRPYEGCLLYTSRRDSYERTENARLKKDIARLRSAARQKADWSQVLERTKIGHKPDGQLAPDRGFVGHRAAKAMKRAKSIEKRQEKALAQKEGLLKNIEKADELRITPLPWRGRLLAVSYTHLDVYKRQTRFCAFRRLCPP